MVTAFAPSLEKEEREEMFSVPEYSMSIIYPSERAFCPVLCAPVEWRTRSGLEDSLPFLTLHFTFTFLTLEVTLRISLVPSQSGPRSPHPRERSPRRLPFVTLPFFALPPSSPYVPLRLRPYHRHRRRYNRRRCCLHGCSFMLIADRGQFLPRIVQGKGQVIGVKSTICNGSPFPRSSRTFLL